MNLELFNSSLFQHSNGEFYPERYTEIPVMTNGSEARCMMAITGLPIPQPNELWRTTFEIHGTNNMLRSRGYGAHLTTEVRVGFDTSHVRDGFSVLRANGGINVGVEAHHTLASRAKSIKWTEAMIEALQGRAPVIKLMVWAGSTQAESGDKLEITPGRGFLQLERFIF